MKNIFKKMFVLMLFMAAQITAVDSNAGKTTSSPWSYYLVGAAGLLGLKMMYNVSRNARMAKNIKKHEELQQSMISGGFLFWEPYPIASSRDSLPCNPTGELREKMIAGKSSNCYLQWTEATSQAIKDQYKGSLERYAAAKRLKSLESYGWFHPGSSYIATPCVQKDGTGITWKSMTYKYPPRINAFFGW